MTQLANNPQGGEAVSSELADTDAQIDTTEDTGTDTEGDEPDGATEAETEEVEHEGKKYKIDKALKPALMFQSDYTKKTQEVAETRRQLEERTTAFANTEKQQSEHLAEVGKVYALHEKVEEWKKTLKSPEWAAFEQQNPGQAQAFFRQYLMDQDSLRDAAGQLQQKVSQRTLEAQRESAKRIEEGHAAFARETKDWNPTEFGKVKDFATREFGLKPADIEAAQSDPRLLKILHRAYLGDQAIKKLAASTKAKSAEDLAPLPTVAGNTRVNTGPRDGDGIEAWMRKRDEQSRKKG